MVTVSRTATAEATAAAVCFELHEAGKRLAQARADESAEWDRLAALLQLAASAGLRVDEIAGRVGISGRTLMDARRSARGAREPRPSLDARVASALGVGEAKSERALIGAVAHGPTRANEVSAALHRLVEAGDVRPVAGGISGNGAVSHYRLTAQGAARLPDRLRQATMSPTREWIVSVASTPTEVGAIDRGAKRLPGELDVSVIRASSRDVTRAPALAWRVEASDPETAIDAAVVRMRELRRDIDGSEAEEPVVVIALAHPHGTGGSPPGSRLAGRQRSKAE